MRGFWHGLFGGRFVASFRGFGDSLGFRLLALLSMALLPLGAISIHGTVELMRAAQAAAERNLVTLARGSLAGERALIESAVASARALEPLVLERLDDPDACAALLAAFTERSAIYGFSGFTLPDGTIPCASDGRAFALGGTEVFDRLRASLDTTVTTMPAASAQGMGQPVLVVTRPVIGGGELAGFLSIAIAEGSLELLGQREIDDAPLLAALVNDAGAIIPSARADNDATLWPETRPLAAMVAQGDSQVFRDTTAGGAPAIYALAELIPGRLYALGMWDGAAPVVAALQTSRLSLLFPAAMWLASLSVVLLAVHYLMVQHLRALGRQMRRFALGQREDWPDLPAHAPTEMRELHGTFRNMARIIARDEDEREAALAEKTLLLKEIHHRVKNNLQLIASVVNMQMRQVSDPSAQRVLHSVQQRVLGLASVHRALYGEDRLARVRADRVIEELLARVTGIGATPGRAPDLRRRLTPLALDADHMVPLSFLLHEALTNALKHLGGNGARGWIAVDLLHEPGAGADPNDHGSVVLRVRNPLTSAAALEADDNVSAEGDGLGRDLIDAFAAQLGGDCRQAVQQDATGAVWVLELRFPAPADVRDIPAADPASPALAPAAQ